MANLNLLLPYKDLSEQSTHLGEDYLVKMQGMVSHNDKQLLVTVLPDRCIFTLLLQHAIKQTADYVRANNLTYSPESTRQLIAFVCGGPFTRVAGDDSLRHDAGASTPVLNPSPSNPHEPTNVHEIPQGRPTKEVRKEKIRQAASRTKRTGTE